MFHFFCCGYSHEYICGLKMAVSSAVVIPMNISMSLNGCFFCCGYSHEYIHGLKMAVSSAVVIPMNISMS